MPWNRLRRSALDEYCCDQCLVSDAPLSAEKLLGALVAPARVPEGLQTSHALCSACAQLHQLRDRHDVRCALAAERLALVTGGWETPASKSLKLALRSRSSETKAVSAFAAVLALLSEEAIAREELPGAGTKPGVIVPVPTSGGKDDDDPIARAALQVASRVSLPVARAISRNKRGSTRGSAEIMRKSIVHEEYDVNGDAIHPVRGANVVLLDDTVTTGHTMAGVARLLREAGAASVTPVTLDRTVSPRVLQRVNGAERCGCPHRRRQLVGQPDYHAS